MALLAPHVFSVVLPLHGESTTSIVFLVPEKGKLALMRRGFATFGGNFGLVFTSEDDLGFVLFLEMTCGFATSDLSLPCHSDVCKAHVVCVHVIPAGRARKRALFSAECQVSAFGRGSSRVT